MYVDNIICQINVFNMYLVFYAIITHIINMPLICDALCSVHTSCPVIYFPDVLWSVHTTMYSHDVGPTIGCIYVYTCTCILNIITIEMKIPPFQNINGFFPFSYNVVLEYISCFVCTTIHIHVTERQLGR